MLAQDENEKLQKQKQLLRHSDAGSVHLITRNLQDLVSLDE